METRQGVEHEEYVSSDNNDSNDEFDDDCEGLADALDYINITDGDIPLCAAVFPGHLFLLWATLYD